MKNSATVKVYYCGNETWQSHMIAIDDKDLRWGEMPFYGRGGTVQEALAETGRQIQEYADKLRAEYLAQQPADDDVR